MSTIFNSNYKPVNLPPSPWYNGCVCGHLYEYRGITFDCRGYEFKGFDRASIPATSVKLKIF